MRRSLGRTVYKFALAGDRLPFAILTILLLVASADLTVRQSLGKIDKHVFSRERKTPNHKLRGAITPTGASDICYMM